MRRFATPLIAALAFALAALPLESRAASLPSTDPADDPDMTNLLEAIHDASTWYHPDLYGMTVGIDHYARKDYEGALENFEYGARYADKFSQLSLGLMYLNGEGTPKDIATAYAWLSLAAERGYPHFIATRDEVAAQMTPDQRAASERIRAQLAETYGDVVAKPRMAVELRLGTMNFTGSRTGFDFGVQHTSAVRCRHALVIGGRALPQIGCDPMNEYFAKNNWQPNLYFALRDREWMPQVTVGDVQQTSSPRTAPMH